MGTTIVLVIVGVVILGVTIFSFQFSNGGSVSDTETGNAPDIKQHFINGFCRITGGIINVT